jgi:hypothetical protein
MSSSGTWNDVTSPHECWYTVGNVLHAGAPQLVQYVGQHADEGGCWWLKDTGVEASGDEWLVILSELMDGKRRTIEKHGVTVVINMAALAILVTEAAVQIAAWRTAWAAQSTPSPSATP